MMQSGGWRVLKVYSEHGESKTESINQWHSKKFNKTLEKAPRTQKTIFKLEKYQKWASSWALEWNLANHFVQRGRRHFYKNYGEDRSAKYGETEKIWPKYGENTFKYWKTYPYSSREISSFSATKLGFFYINGK